MDSKYHRIMIIIGIVSPVYYFLLLSILGLLWDGYDPISQSMSEIGAVDSLIAKSWISNLVPWEILFRDGNPFQGEYEKLHF